MSREQISAIANQINELREKQQKLIEGVLDKVNEKIKLTFKRTEEYDDNNYYTSFRLAYVGDWFCEGSDYYLGAGELVKLQKIVKKRLAEDREGLLEKANTEDAEYCEELVEEAGINHDDSFDSFDLVKMMIKACDSGVPAEDIEEVLSIADGYANENNVNPEKYEVDN